MLSIFLSYGGYAPSHIQLKSEDKVLCLLWEREARVRVSTLGKPGKPWGVWVDSTFPFACNWSKNDLDHMFDHNWKIS